MIKDEINTNTVSILEYTPIFDYSHHLGTHKEGSYGIYLTLDAASCNEGFKSGGYGIDVI